jgi:hypothetical protein
MTIQISSSTGISEWLLPGAPTQPLPAAMGTARDEHRDIHGRGNADQRPADACAEEPQSGGVGSQP